MAKRRGRPPIEITQEMLGQVEVLAGQGLTAEQIANCLGIGRTTLYDKINDNEDFSNAIKEGQGKAAGFVTGKLFDHIRNGNLAAIFFYCKTRLGWKETTRNEHTGKDGAPLQLESHQKNALEAMNERFTQILGQSKEATDGD